MYYLLQDDYVDWKKKKKAQGENCELSCIWAK